MTASASESATLSMIQSIIVSMTHSAAAECPHPSLGIGMLSALNGRVSDVAIDQVSNSL